MQIKTINTEKLVDLYENYLIYDFPEEELKSLEMIKSYMENGIYTIYGLYEEEELLAYAMFLNNKERGFALLDYFASNRKYRSKGYGSTLLRMLREKDTTSNGYIIEVESLRTAKDEEERVLRERRIAFYEKNGLRKTALRACVYGVEFAILYLSLCVDVEDICLYEELKALYLLMFGEEKCREQTTVQLL